MLISKQTRIRDLAIRSQKIEIRKMAKPELNNDMPFTATNYKLLLIGLAIVMVGYRLMSGGGNGDPTTFNADELFSTRRITVAPIVVLIGYGFVAYAILKKTGENEVSK